MVKNLLSKVRDVGSIPDQETKIPHAMENQAWATATEPEHSEAQVSQFESPARVRAPQGKICMRQWSSHGPQQRPDAVKYISK